MGKVIITQKSSTLRTVARNVLRGNWITVAKVIFVYLILVDFAPTAINMILGESVSINLKDFFGSHDILGYNLGEMGLFLEKAGDNFLKISFGGKVYSYVFSGVFTFGLVWMLLSFVRTRKVQFENLFEGFTYFLKTLLLYVLISVKVMLWGILFIVPGIIAAFNYSQAFYIMADNPRKSPLQCIKESCELMQGNKLKYFCFELSFIGWNILSVIVMPFLAIPFYMVQGTLVGDIVLSLVMLIPNAIFMTYLGTAQTVFYETLMGNMKPVEFTHDNIQYINNSEFTSAVNGSNCNERQFTENDVPKEQSNQGSTSIPEPIYEKKDEDK